MKINEIEKEAHVIIEASDIAMPKSWIIGEIVSRPWLAVPDDAGEAVAACVYYAVGSAVREALRSYKSSEGGGEQLILEGFERVQQRYVTKRDGEMVVVPVHLLTDAEIEAKAEELDRMSEGLQAHAQELRQYAEERASAKTG